MWVFTKIIHIIHNKIHESFNVMWYLMLDTSGIFKLGLIFVHQKKYWNEMLNKRHWCLCLDRTLKLSSQFCIELIQHKILLEVWIAITLNLSYYSIWIFIMGTLNYAVHHLIVKSLYIPLSNWVVRKICIIWCHMCNVSKLLWTIYYYLIWKLLFIYNGVIF